MISCFILVSWTTVLYLWTTSKNPVIFRCNTTNSSKKAQRFQQIARFLVTTEFIQINKLQQKNVTKWSRLRCNCRDTNWIVTLGPTPCNRFSDLKPSSSIRIRRYMGVISQTIRKAPLSAATDEVSYSTLKTFSKGNIIPVWKHKFVSNIVRSFQKINFKVTIITRSP